jgi:hypothetical protein
MKRIILLLLSAVLVINTVFSQEYHPHDLGKLKAFLVQPSAIAGKTNGEQLGLTASEVSVLDASESWVSGVEGVVWTKVVPKRLSEIKWYGKKLAGNLDASGLPSLSSVNYGYNQLTTLDMRDCESLTLLQCYSNRLTVLDIGGCTSLVSLECSGNELTTVDISGSRLLVYLNCRVNKLTTLDLTDNTSLETINCGSNPLTDMTVGFLIPPPPDNGAIDGWEYLERLLFPDVSVATLHVPAATAPLYQAARVWRDFGNIVESGSVSTAFLPSPLVTVFFSANTLSVLTPNNETVTVYSANGSLLFRSSKLPGAATFPIGHLPKGVIIVKGSTGWVRKIFR